MKLLSYALDHKMEPRLAFLCQEQVIDVMRAAFWLKIHRNRSEFIELASSMRNLLDDWSTNFPMLRELDQIFGTLLLNGLNVNNRPIAHGLDEVIIFPPIPDPPGLREFQQPSEAGNSLSFHFLNHNALLGHFGHLQKPLNTSMLDFKLELGCIIGLGGRNFTESAAEKCIAGFTIMVGWVDREKQQNSPDSIKGQDFGTSLGPYLVTIDEFENSKFTNRYNLATLIRRNGQDLSRGNAQNLPFSIGEMVAHAAESVDLYPGDIIGSQTIGKSSISNLGPENAGGWLKVGDVMEFEIQGIGKLTNTVIDNSNAGELTPLSS